MKSLAGKSALFLMLSILTQVGGLALLVALFFKRRLLVFVAAYALLLVTVPIVAPLTGRVSLSCAAEGPLQMQSRLYCLLHRHYVTPELKQVLEDLATDVEQEFSGATTLVLDGNFPFFTGFPLLPHLSHHDGRKVDLAFYYAKAGVYVPGITRSPIGYFAFEPGPTDCPANWLTLRWDMQFAQGWWRKLGLDARRNTYALQWLNDDPRVGKVLLEPHLKAQFIPNGNKIRFQGCRAARHDDHIHLQL